MRTLRTAAFAAFLVICLDGGLAWAVSTETWESKGSEEFGKGKMEGTALGSDGELLVSPAFEKLPTSEVGIWCSVTSGTGVTYFGTGKFGSIYKLAGDKMEPVASKTGFIVSALAADKTGNVYAASLPGGRITKIGPDGKSSLLVDLPVLYTWALACDSRGNLFAATGPTGTLVRIDAAGKATVLYKSRAGHIFSLAVDPDDNVYFGTAAGAVLLRIDAAQALGELVAARVVYDFAGSELKSIRIHDGMIYAAVNNTKDLGGTGPEHEMAKAEYRAAAVMLEAKEAGPSLYEEGAGVVYEIAGTGEGEAEPKVVYENGSHFIVAMTVDVAGDVYIATSEGGGLVRYTPESDQTMRIEIKEKQILTLDLKEGALHIIGTSSPGVLYRRTDPPRIVTFTSRVFSAGLPAKWGDVTWEGSGSIKVAVRAGDTLEPDETWSEWKPVAKSGDAAGTGETKYCQYRVTWEGKEAMAATFKGARLSYLPINAAPRIDEISVAREPAVSEKEKEEERLPATRKITWKASDANKDKLGFRVYYRLTAEEGWHLLNRDALLTRSEYELDLDKMAAGRYVIKVEATDELSNPEGRSLSDEMDSEPFLLDNSLPGVTLDQVMFVGNEVRISGSAVDPDSAITKIEYALDGGDWKSLHPVDEVYDSKTESFVVKLTVSEKGSHTIAVKAADSNGNSSVVQKVFKIN